MAKAQKKHAGNPSKGKPKTPSRSAHKSANKARPRPVFAAAPFRVRRGGEPAFHTRSGGTVIRSEDGSGKPAPEYIGDITGQSTFKSTVYELNPGLLATFPKLAGPVSSWESYRWNKLVFVYKSTSGTAVGSTSTALGTVILGTQYDLSEPPFSTKVQMENFAGTVDGAPYKNIRHDVLAGYPQPERTLMVRTAATTDGYDPRLFDLGRFAIAVQGMQATNVVGELWVEWEIEVYKMKLPTVAQGVSLSQRIVGATNVTSSNIFGDSPVTTGNTIATAAGSTLTFPSAGQFILSVSVTGTGGIAGNVVAITGTATCVAVDGSTGIFLVGTTLGTKTFTVNATAGSTVILNYVSAPAMAVVNACTARLSQYTTSLAEKRSTPSLEDRLALLESRLSDIAESDDEECIRAGGGALTMQEYCLKRQRSDRTGRSAAGGGGPYQTDDDFASVTSNGSYRSAK